MSDQAVVICEYVLAGECSRDCPAARENRVARSSCINSGGHWFYKYRCSVKDIEVKLLDTSRKIDKKNPNFIFVRKFGSIG